MAPRHQEPAARSASLVQRMQQATDRIAALYLQADDADLPADAHWQLDARAGQDLFLMPGQLHFGGRAASLRTLLGSCIAITLWHPTRGLGGMCHYLLPSRPRSAGQPLDGRYGDEALQTLLACIRNAGTEPQEYHAHLHGGADTLPAGSCPLVSVGERNIETGRHFIERFGFRLQGADVGGDMPRSVGLLLATGAVTLRRGSPLQSRSAGIGSGPAG